MMSSSTNAIFCARRIVMNSCNNFRVEIKYEVLSSSASLDNNVDLEVDGCEVSLVETETALGVVTSRFFYSCSARRRKLMAKKSGGLNPFYVLLVLIGIAFTLTACAYGVMAFKVVRTKAEVAEDGEGAALLTYLDEHGATLMAVEVALLALCTVAAMATDRYWIRRDERRAKQSPGERGKQ